MSREDAVAALTDGLDGVTDEDIEVVAGESSAQLTPADVGLDVDIDATVDRALGFSLDPRVMWERFAGETTIEPAFAIDERSEEHTSELHSRFDLVCRLL